MFLFPLPFTFRVLVGHNLVLLCPTEPHDPFRTPSSRRSSESLYRRIRSLFASVFGFTRSPRVISMTVLLSVFVARAVFRIPISTIRALSSWSATVFPSLYSAHRKSTKLKSSPCSHRRDVSFPIYRGWFATIWLLLSKPRVSLLQGSPSDPINLASGCSRYAPRMFP
jgi:hypothetical protein